MRAMHCSLMLLLVSLPAAGQDARVLTGRVTDIAGTTFYVDLGRDSGLVQGDTIGVALDSIGVQAAPVLIQAVSSERSLLTFLDTPLPVTRGGHVFLHLQPSAPVVAHTTSASAGSASRGVLPPPPQLHGRLALEVSGMRSTTARVGSETPGTDRTFATPVARMRFRVDRLPGGFELNTNLRAATRYSSDDLVEPATTVRVYRAALETTGDGPVDLHVGRFANPYETFSGYWDGAAIRVGGRGFGIGGAAGFEPSRADEGFSTEDRKFSGFLNYSAANSSVRYETDISIHRVIHTVTDNTGTFAGWSQQLGIGRFRISHRLLVDRDRTSGDWVVANFRARAAVPLTRGLTTALHYAFRRPRPLEPDSLGEPLLPVPFGKSEQAGASVTVSGRAGFLTGELTGNRLDGGDARLAYAATAYLRRIPGLEVSFSATGRTWSWDTTRGIYVSPTITRAVGAGFVRGAYTYYRTEFAMFSVTTHAGELGVTVPMGGLVLDLSGKIQQGNELTSTSFRTTFWTTF